jgi:hypothetical protein
VRNDQSLGYLVVSRRTGQRGWNAYTDITRRDELGRTRICAYMSMHETLYRSFVTSSLSQGVKCVVVVVRLPFSPLGNLPARQHATWQYGSIAFARFDMTAERSLKPGRGRGETGLPRCARRHASVTSCYFHSMSTPLPTPALVDGGMRQCHYIESGHNVRVRVLWPTSVRLSLLPPAARTAMLPRPLRPE